MVLFFLIQNKYNEKELIFFEASSKTESIWTYILMNKEQFTNKFYQSFNGAIKVSTKKFKVKIWKEYFMKYSIHNKDSFSPPSMK